MRTDHQKGGWQRASALGNEDDDAEDADAQELLMPSPFPEHRRKDRSSRSPHYMHTNSTDQRPRLKEKRTSTLSSRCSDSVHTVSSEEDPSSSRSGKRYKKRTGADSRRSKHRAYSDHSESTLDEEEEDMRSQSTATTSVLDTHCKGDIE